MAAATAGLIAGGLSGGGDDDTSQPAPLPPDPIAVLGDRELAGQRLIAGFDGPTPPVGLRRMIAAGGLAGVILFDENVTTRARTARVIASLQAIERPPGLDSPLAVMVDQEGGWVRRVPGPPSASAAQMAELGPDYARRQGSRAAGSLLSYGINVDLAPVLDLGRPGSAIAAEGRTFGPTPETVTSSGVDGFAAGLREGGVAATAKHFPGLGGAATNTDLAAQEIGLGARELRVQDAAPFEAFASSGGELIMLGLASYPALGDRPAAFEPEIATGELRERIGFEGVSITDSLDAAAALAFGDRDRVALAAAGAGSDLLLYGDWRTARGTAETLAGALRDGRLERQDFEESVRRVLEFRAGLATGPGTESP